MKIPRNVAVKQFANPAGKVVSIVADTSVSNQLPDNGVSVDGSRNLTIRVTVSVYFKREGISFIIDVGFYSIV